ncbi:MAG: cadherin repeat domain-containing protein, partial [Bacteroidota bacterium]
SVAGNSINDFVAVTRENEAPVSIALPDNNIAENSGEDALVGTFSVIDDDGDTHTYALVAGDGDDDNALFSIDGDELLTLNDFDFETSSAYSVRVRASDNLGNDTEESFTVNVTNIVETDTDILSLTIPEEVSPAIIDAVNHTVVVDIGFGNDATSLTPTIEVSSSSSVSPTSGATRDFSLAQTYTVTAENGSTQDWLVSVRGYYPSQTFTVGPTGDYANLIAAFNNLRSVGIGGDIALALEDGYTDPGGTLQGGWDGQETYTVTVQPEAGATTSNISSSSFRTLSFQDLENVTFDGKGVMEINNENGFGTAFDFTGAITSENITITDVAISTRSGSALLATIVDGLVIENCSYEFSTPFQTRNSTVFFIGDTAPNAVIRDNRITLGDQFDGNFSINVFSSDHNSTRVYNNVIHAQPTESSLFSVFNDKGEFAHNTVVVDGDGTIGSLFFIRAANSSAEIDINNNIFFADIDYTSFALGMQLADPLPGTVNIDGNTLYINEQDGISTSNIRIGSTNYLPGDEATVAGFADMTSFAEPIFTDRNNEDFTLTSGSLTDPDMRGIAFPTVNTDFNGSTRSSTAPSKGAFESPNNIANITDLSFAGISGDAAIDNQSQTATAFITNPANRSSLAATLTLFPGASTSNNGVAMDYTTPVTFDITAEDGTMQTWTINILGTGSTWIGGSVGNETNWNTADNWSEGTIPDETENVLIPATVNQPVIASAAKVDNLVIEEGAIVTVSVSGTLAIAGEVTLDGTGTVSIEKAVDGDLALSMIGSTVENASVSDLGADLAFAYDDVNNQFVSASGPLNSGTAVFAAFDAAGPTLTMEGTPNHGTVAITLSKQGSGENGVLDGFNIVANPYTDAIDREVFLAANDNATGGDPFEGTNISGTIWIWNDGGANAGGNRVGDYIAVNAMGVTDPSGNGVFDETTPIAPGQGFFVLASNNMSPLQFTPDMQVSLIPSTPEREQNQENTRDLVKLVLSGTAKAGNLYNELIVGLDEQATTSLDYGLDGLKFSGSQDISFYSMGADERLAIQALPLLSDEARSVPLGFYLSTAGTYQIEVKELV